MKQNKHNNFTHKNTTSNFRLFVLSVFPESFCLTFLYDVPFIRLFNKRVNPLMIRLELKYLCDVWTRLQLLENQLGQHR